MNRPRKVLLISPGFHGYWRSIARALEHLGHDVSTLCYDALPTPTAKLRHQVGHELPARLGRDTHRRLVSRASKAARQALAGARPDVVVVVKGDRLGEPFFDQLAAQGVPAVLWLYDELRRTRHNLSALAGYSGIASYSARDTRALSLAGLTARHLPLAFDPAIEYGRRDTGAVVFIGSRYPVRERLLTGLHRAGVPVRVYGRDWSGHPVDRLRTWRWERPPLAAGRDVPLDHAYALMAGSPATVNMHADQDGFTMRTFEAGGVGAVQLIDRPDVAELYLPGEEIVVFDGLDELVEVARRAVADRAWGEAIRVAARRRTLAEHTFVHRVKALQTLWEG